MTQHLLADAIAEEKGLRLCKQHPEAVWYDEAECPACAVLIELGRTEWMLRGRQMKSLEKV